MSPPRCALPGCAVHAAGFDQFALIAGLTWRRRRRRAKMTPATSEVPRMLRVAGI
jgi:hypothetical protein